MIQSKSRNNVFRHKCIQCGSYSRWIKTDYGLQCECGYILEEEYNW